MVTGVRGSSRTPWLTLAIVLFAILAWSLVTESTRSIAPDTASLVAEQVSTSIPPTKVPTPHFTGAGPTRADPGLTWTELSPARMPPQRVDGGMVFDSTDGYVLLFGGYAYESSPAAYYNDTWTFSAGEWTNVTNPLAAAPSPRSEIQLADDPTDHEVVLFGGYSAKGELLDDTWTYSAGAWTNVTGLVGTAPPATVWGSMAYDNQTGTVILFGGLHSLTIPSEQYTNETWSFSDNKWTELSPATSPPARNLASLVDDVSDGDLLLFGGQNDSGPFNDTWTFSGTDWSRVTPTFAPPVSWGAGLAYYAAQSEVVQFGGTPAYEYYTYTYHAGVWSQYDSTPNPGQSIGTTPMVYDYADQYVLLFGESPASVNSTWKLSITSGPPPPALNVGADATPQSGVVPLPVAFTSEISGGTPPYTVTWNFGDSTPVVRGNPSAAGNTSHTYESVGKYNATLTVVDSVDATVEKNWTITVTSPALTLKISATPTSAAVNQTVTFTSTPSGGTPPYTYSWTFGDGGTATTRNATHEYAAAGKFTAELIVRDNAGSSASQNVTITVTTAPPTPVSSPSDGWIYVVAAVVVVLVAILLFFWTRRRKQQTPPKPAEPNSPAGPGG
jgi:PKD repeat protein